LIKKIKEKLAARKLSKILKKGFGALPKDLREIINLIQERRPHPAKDRFKLGLRDQLLLRHKEIFTHEKNAFKKEKKGFLFTFSPLKYGFAAICVLLITALVSYPLIPPPKVQSAERQEDIIEISSNGVFKIIFTQPMDKSSTEKAFAITPTLEGKFEWDRNALIYKPDKKMEIGRIYNIEISTKAKSLIQKNLVSPYKQTFKIIKSPQISVLTPAENVLVGKDARITVYFDRPMQALSTIEKLNENSKIFTIVPEVKGTFKYLGTRGFQFIPDSLPLSTQFKITVNAGIQSLYGGTLEEPYIRNFSTLRPQVESISPQNGNDFNGPTTTLQLNFNQIIDLNSANDKIKVYKYKGEDKNYISNLKQSIDEIDGRFKDQNENNEVNKPAEIDIDLKNWQEIKINLIYLSEIEKQNYEKSLERAKKDKKEIAPLTEKELEEFKKTIVITPNKKFEFSKNYLIRIEKDLKAIEGNVGIEKEKLSLFTTVGKPKILSYTPGDYDKNYYQYYITAKFSNPMDLESIKEKIKIYPEHKNYKNEISYGSDNNEIIYYFDYKPSTEYKIVFPAGMEDYFGQKTEEEKVISFKTRQAYASYELLSKGEIAVLNSNFAPEYFVSSTNLKKINLKYKALETQEFEYLYRNGYLGWDETPNPPFKEMEITLNYKKDQKILTKLDFNEIAGKILTPGFYYFELSSDEVENYNGEKFTNRSKQYFVLTNTALTYKRSPDKILIWATDLKTGLPISDIDLFVKKGDKLIADGRPDSRGLFEKAITENTDYQVFGKRDAGDISFVDENWNEGINSWHFNIPFNSSPSKYLVYLYTERPIYRPGQTVYFKGILRRDDDATLLLPDEKEIEISIQDSRYQEILKKRIPINKNGSFNGELQLSESAALGEYILQANFVIENSSKTDYLYSENFTVAEYRKPDFKLDLKPEKESYINGEKAIINMNGSYFFGAPLANQEITYHVISKDYFFDKYEDEYYSFFNDGDDCYWGCSGSSEFILEGKSAFSSNGTAQISIPLEITDKKQSQIYTIEATTIGENQQAVSNRIVVPIHKGEYYLGIRTDTYVFEENKPFNVKIISLLPDGKIAPQKNFSIEGYERKWNTIKKQNFDGSFYYENSYEDKLIDQKKSTTSKNGKAEMEFKLPSGGIYKLVVKGTDQRGNEISSSTTIYVSSNNFIHYGRENNDRIELIPDKKEYKIGETAKIMIKSPYQNVKALMTIERGKFLSKKIIDIESNSSLIEIPVTSEFLPNVYVSVILVKGSGEDQKYLQTRLQKLIIQTEEEIKVKEEKIMELNNRIKLNFDQIEDEKEREKSDSSLVSEIENIEAQIVDLNKQNNTSKKELDSLSTKKNQNNIENKEDGNLAGFKLGYTTLRITPENKKMDIKILTDKKTYKPGEKVTVQIKTLNHENKGIPGEVSLSVIDDSLFSLTESNLNDILSQFYSQRELSVVTAQTLEKAIARINVEAAKGSKGGGGGGDSGIKTRSNFKDIAHWNAEIETNNKGEATISFTVPDNLTTWQIVAVGATKNTQVGINTQKITVAQDIMIQPILPRFLIRNDEAEIGAVVHNYTDKAIDSEIKISVSSLSLNEDSVKKFHLDPKKQIKLTWKVKVLKENQAQVKYRVTTGNKGDELEMKIPIYGFGIPEYIATSGILKENKSQIEELILPSNIDPGLGSLNITVSPTLADSIGKGMDYLETYPYACAEQTASSLLPNFIIKQIANFPTLKNNIQDIKNLDKQVEVGLQRIYKLQNSNGGWGLWENSLVNPHLSAYVLYTLYQGEKAGYIIDQEILSRGNAYLTQHLQDHKIDEKNSYEIASRAFVLYILSEINNGDLGLTNNLYSLKNKLNIAGKAYLAMTYDNIIRKQNIAGIVKTNTFARIDTLIDEIISEQKATPRGIHFEEKENHYLLFDTNTRTTALVLQMLNRLDPENILIEKIIKFLLLERKDGTWSTTQETVYSIISLIEYLNKSQELNPNFWAAIDINNKREEEAYFSSETISDKGEVQKKVANLLLNDQINQIKIVHGDGIGNLYYDINLSYYLPVEEIKELDQGFAVINEYFELEDKIMINSLPSLNLGKTYKSKITLIVPEDRYYVLVEDFIPAGLEIIDFNLKNTAQSIKMKYDKENVNNEYWDWYAQNNYFNHQEIRDDRIAYFADYLPKGVYELEYFVRATSSGEFHDKPAFASEMYFAEVFGRSNGKLLEIKK